MKKVVLYLLHRRKAIFLFVFVAVVLYAAALFTHPKPLFNDPFSAVLSDKNGQLLSARIAADGQWRFPAGESIPEKYKKALLAFEDKRFYYHPGFDPVATIRALIANVRKKKIVQGGSTLTMQVIRLSRKGKSRVISEKLIEFWKAIALEMTHSKSDILNLYAANAPFGGNVVGLDAAAWRWFGRPPDELSWAEAATLAILPNAPSLISLQKNRAKFLAKRNSLLQKLHENGYFDALTLALSTEEPLPELPLALPDKAPHYIEYLRKSHGDRLYATKIDATMQQQVETIIKMHSIPLKANAINHIAVIIRTVADGNVIVYHGNVSYPESNNGQYNDMVQAARSSGSILKPFLFAAALQDGIIHTSSLLPDVPSWLAGFNPKNFDERYSGAITASVALQRSLNVPFVHLLRDFGVPRFHLLLQKLGFTTFTKPASHYGLSLILGGGEVNLWELSAAYAAFASQLISEKHDYPLTKGCISLTTNVLRQLNRPETESGWHFTEDALKMAWKTGTSFGFRDAWAVGYTPAHVIAVWVGNADGHGRPGLTGISAAAPLLFDIASLTGNQNWFAAPLSQLQRLEVCASSGYTPGPFCKQTKSIDALLNTSSEVPVCNHHQLIRTDNAETFRIPGDCMYPHSKMVSWFVLPPLMEYYYKLQHPDYKPMPPIIKGCSSQETIMDFVYPPNDAIIYQPIIYSGNYNPVIFEIVHRDPQAVLFWHLDNKYTGQTLSAPHQLQIPKLPAGSHVVTVVDQAGNSQSRSFTLQNQSTTSRQE